MKYLLLLALSLGLLCLLFKPSALVYSQANDPYANVIFANLKKQMDNLPEDSGVLIALPGGISFSKNPDQQFSFYDDPRLNSPQEAVNFIKNMVDKKIEASDTTVSTFTSSNNLPSAAGLISKVGISGEGRGEVGTFLDDNGRRAFFAIFLPSGGANSETLISNLEKLMYNPSAPLTDTLSPAQTPAAASGRGTTAGSRICVKVGEPSDPMPEICNIPTFGGTSAGGPHPQAPPAGGDLQIEIQRQFGVSMLGFDQQHLQWAWEKFWEVSNTKFNTLVSGTVIQAIADISATSQDAYYHVNLGQFPEESAFKHTLTHELGHVIRNYAGRENAQETAFLRALHAEGGVSYYAQNAYSCTKSDTPSEDYAEMIAFYLNPGTPVASYLKCYQQSQNRFTQEQFPLHYQVARDVLGEF